MIRRNLLAAVACYLALVTLVVGFSLLRVRTRNQFAVAAAPDSLPEHPTYNNPPDENAKPFFSLSTNRTYGTGDRARVWVNYRGLDQLDLRVYRVKDPVKFFKGLDNPHQVGREDREEVAASFKRRPTLLEKLRLFKSSIYKAIRGYFRAQLQNQSRRSFNQKFSLDTDDTSNRTPLGVADYARVPLLNPDQMVSSWREHLPPLENEYDRRMISLGRREPGVYLIEGVHADLRAYSVAIVTDLTMLQKTSRDGQVLVYAVDRKSGEPREGVRIEIVKAAKTLTSGTTDRQGILKTKLDRKAAAQKRTNDTASEADEAEADEAEADEEPLMNSYLVMATAGNNFAISDLDSFYFGEGEAAGSEEIRSYIYTDRPVYRPAQRVYFKGILRRLTEDGYKLVPGSRISVSIEDPTGARLFDRELTFSSRGTFSGELDLAEDAPLGSYHITAQAGEQAAASGYFEVQEYKKPEFKVNVTTGEKYVGVNAKAKFTVSATYFFGAPVARAGVKYYIYRARYYPWWRGDLDEADELGVEAEDEPDAGYADYGGYGDQMVAEGEGQLDAGGRLQVEFTVPPPANEDTWDYTYRLEAQVTDASRRMMEGSSSFVGVRGNVVATANPERYVYFQGDTAKILVRTNDHEGRSVATRVKLTFVERRWEKVTKRTENGDEYADYDLKERELSAGFVETNPNGEAAYDYQIPISGSVHIKTAVEENNRLITYHGGSIWVADRSNQWSDFAYQGEEAIKLVPDKKSYRPGDTAHVLALLPTDNAHLLVTTELMSVMTVRQISATGRAIVIDVPIEARYAPDVFLNVSYVRGGDMYTQDQMLVVPARDRLLNLEIVPNKQEYKPREAATYTVLARNADGSPASNAEVSLGVVDESIYSIRPESVGDIRREFYGRRYNAVQTNFSTSYFFTGYAGKKSIKLAQNKKAYQLADFKNDGELVQPMIRRIFKDTAFWQPNVVTGPDGKASVQVDLPDNLTTWRATARAITSDTRVGTTIQKVVARKDVILRMALPRFLTAGDTVTLSGITHNYLAADKTTQISLEVSGARLLDAPLQTVTIPRQGEHRTDWRVAVPETGELKILAKALTDTESDAVELTIPIVPRGLKHTRGESVAIPDEEIEKTFTYNLPGNADAHARHLRIEVAPSIAGTLFGALDYLTGYPYGCTEQTMSQFLPTVIVAQTLKDVQTATIKDSNDIRAKVRRGLRRLYGFQHEDGGWGWWKDDPTDAFMSAYVVDGLVMAQRAGYEVDAVRLARGREKLGRMLDAGKTDDGASVDTEIRAYIVYVLNETGETNVKYVNDLFAKRDQLQPYGRALLALTLNVRGDRARAQTVAGEIERSAVTNDQGAHWPSRHKGAHGVEENTIEATALSVKALARIAPQNPLLPKAARWLVTSRRHGYYWLSTKDTAFAIFGLTDYLKVSEELTPDYTVEVYVGGEQVLARQVTSIDATAAAGTFVIERRGRTVGNQNEVRVVKRGRGMLYLSTTLTHYTNEEQVVAQSSPQLKLTREYLRLRVGEGEGGAPAWKVEPLAGELRSGDMIVARLHVEGRGARLLIEDPIPAGCEQIGQVSGLDLTHRENGWSDWYSEREFRDQKTVLFVNYFDGKATYQYAMRVQVPGEFRVAPARVEQMYQPTVNANTASAGLTILDSR